MSLLICYMAFWLGEMLGSDIVCSACVALFVWTIIDTVYKGSFHAANSCTQLARQLLPLGCDYMFTAFCMKLFFTNAVAAQDFSCLFEVHITPYVESALKHKLHKTWEAWQYVLIPRVLSPCCIFCCMKPQKWNECIVRGCMHDRTRIGIVLGNKFCISCLRSIPQQCCC